MPPKNKKSGKAAAKAAPQAQEDGKSRKPRLKVDWTETPYGVFLKSSQKVLIKPTLAAFASLDDALAFIEQELPLRQQDKAVIAQMQAVQVERRTSVSLD